MNTCHNIYVLAIDNKELAITTTAVQLTRYKQKRSRSSSVTTSLARQHPSALAYLEKYGAFLYQSRTILEPSNHHHQLLSTTTTWKYSSFVQALKVINWVNYIKGDIALYDKSSTFGILTDTITCTNLPSTPQIP